MDFFIIAGLLAIYFAMRHIQLKWDAEEDIFWFARTSEDLEKHNLLIEEQS